MPQFAFGGGALYGLRTDIANGTPIRFGALQNVQLDFSGDLKELYGSGQYAMALARGKSKIEGKAQFAQINGAVFNALFFGQTLTSGSIALAGNEAATVPASTPYHVTPINASTFQADLGVFYAATGLPLTYVAAGPAAGQYTLSGTSYVFAAADAGAALLLNYLYGASGGGTIAIENAAMGAAPTFQAVFTEQYAGKQLVLRLNACVAAKLSLPSKQDDWTIAALDFQAQADAAGAVGALSLSE
jgi:hypothetical protein